MKKSKNAYRSRVYSRAEKDATLAGYSKDDVKTIRCIAHHHAGKKFDSYVGVR